jgi:gentisate 1,2-dioxygenase
MHHEDAPLGSIADLPADYVAAMRAANLVPLWPSLRALLPPLKPAALTQPTHWAYDAIRPLLLRAGELTPIEKAERRVLVLANPGHGLDKMQASPAIYLGMQLLLPGEWAPSHRHTPNAVRMIVEGTGAYTTVDGQKLTMERGDLILTPTGLWHEHGHDGDAPVIWLDVLDLPLMVYMEASYHVNGGRQTVVGSGSSGQFSRGGVVPTRVSAGPAQHRYPMLRYAWADAKAALQNLSGELAADELVQITYVNPQTGEHAENVLGFYALMLRPGQTATLPASSPAKVLHAIDGAASVAVGGVGFDLQTADTCCAPGYTAVSLANASKTEPAFLFMADETPLHEKLGVFEVR